MAQAYNWSVDAGTDQVEIFTYCEPSEDDPSVPGAPIDVTDWSALLQLRVAPGASLLLSLSDGEGIVVGGADGTFTVTVTAEQSAALGVASALYDLLVTPPGADPIRLAEGTVTVNPAISIP